MFADRLQRISAAAGEAVDRLEAVSEADAVQSFGPLGETLTWVCALDEMLMRNDGAYPAKRDNDAVGRTLRGLRFVRNHAVHGINVASVVDRRPGGLTLPFTLPGVVPAPHLVWLAAEALPPLDRPARAQESAYGQHLAGREVLPSLRAAVAYLIAWSSAPGPAHE